MRRYARVFQSGNSQAVRLPKEFRFDVDEVEVVREGDAIILRPRQRDDTRWAAVKAAIARGFSDDFLQKGREQQEEQDRPDLDEVFP